MALFPWHTRLRELKRYREVVQALVKFGYVDVAEALHLWKPLRLGRRLLGTPDVTAAKIGRAHV